MEDNYKYSDWRRKEYIKKYEVPNAESYFWELANIEHSFSGRIDVPLANTFIMEAIQLIVNSIILFENGYFDAAYYSLREAIEISTTIVYLSDMPDEERVIKMEAWKNTQEFPMQGQMLQQLYQYGNVISDMKEKMTTFFENIKITSKSINKYVHKQGLKNFYVSRNHPINSKKSDEEFINKYIFFLEKTIGIIAVMRLAIDPYPILLMDEEILLRCFDSLTEAYGEEFVKKYITEETINDYKKTEIFINHYNEHMTEEKKNIAIFEIMKYQAIDTSKKEDILSQIHLLDDLDTVATYIAFSSNKVVRIYTYGGLQMYSTDRETIRENTVYGGPRFKAFEDNLEKYNQIYDEAFMSVFEFVINGKIETFFVEHNEILSKDDIKLIKNCMSKKNNKCSE